MRRIVFKCKCDCGNIAFVKSENLRRGSTKSCGCLRKEVYDEKLCNLAGQRFGRLTALERADDYIDKNGEHFTMWKCECDCGVIKNIRAKSLKRGETKSCGCLVKEAAKIRGYEQGLKSRKYNKYDMSGKYGIGYTTNCNKDGVNYFYFDKEDFDKIKGYCWHFNGGGYLATNGHKGELHRALMHRCLFPISSDYVIDHINHKPYDNRKCNLRVCTHAQNCRNKKVVGVYFDKNRNRYEAYITVNKKRHHIGWYKNFDDAIKARKEAEEKYFGEYSFSNSNKEIINNEVSN